ncbi:MAG: hypothetical protein M1829_003576 [Trizodia sp. TS-e1964]|nr:MAG: hypothetical protein M1829_003576 [Trizodia sp. TS-e1964]
MPLDTKLVQVNVQNLGNLSQTAGLEPPPASSTDLKNLWIAAEKLRTSDVPVAFPTETVYGLGADATRSAAVRNIFRAKNRPQNNPLIVHICSTEQLASLLLPAAATDKTKDASPIPAIYTPLIERFWPGPLTLVLPLPPNTPLSREVTCGMPTFCARMPSGLARALIQLAGMPVAAPSANTSGLPSPTTALHVMKDMSGKIEMVVDGGRCAVGLESTIVDGLVSPPRILRPGAVSIQELRACPGWEEVVVAYKDGPDPDGYVPGTNYRHYAPSAPVVLFKPGMPPPDAAELAAWAGPQRHVGVVTMRLWAEMPRDCSAGIKVSVVETGSTPAQIAFNLFYALRQLDMMGPDFILVETLGHDEGPLAAAIMNRLRKASSPPPLVSTGF